MAVPATTGADVAAYGAVIAMLALSFWIPLASGRAMLGATSFALIGGALAAWLTASAGPMLALVAGAAGAALTGAAFAWLTARANAVEFAIASLAWAAPWWMARTPLEASHRATPLHAAAVVAIAAAVFAGTWFATRSRIGRMARAVSEDARGAASIGIAPAPARRAAITLGACVGGVAGAVAALMPAGSAPDLGWAGDIAAIAAAVTGGAGTLAGPIVGAVIVTAIGSAWPMSAAALDAALAATCMLALPGGVASAVERAVRR